MYRISPAICLLLILLSTTVRADDQTSSPRETALVRVIRQVQPAIAVIYSRSRNQQSAGSGAVIDPRGYVLTAKHVTGKQHIVVLGGRPPLQAALVGSMPEYDLALLKLGPQAFTRPASPEWPLAGTPPAFLALGTATELMLGEPVLNIGSPGGRGIVVTRGILSSLGITGSNALAQATQSSNGWNEFLQFDAASNPGNSGGPLINAVGQQIGVVTSSIRGEEGIHFAVPPDRIRISLADMLYAELRHRCVSGITIDPQAASVRVSIIDEDSPAANSGIRADDEIITVDGRRLRDPADWEFTRFDFRPNNEVKLGLRRSGREFLATFKLGSREPRAGLEVAQKAPGLFSRAAVYDPRLSDPLRDDDRPAGPPVIIPEVTATPPELPREDHYELVQEGLLQVPKTGLYRMALKSDDGARLFVHNQLVVDNGGNHADQLRTGWVDLAAGLHPIRIEYYEDEGHESLALLMAEGDTEPIPVPASRLWHRVEPE